MAQPLDPDDLPDHPDGGVPDYVESIVGDELRIFAIRDRKRDVLKRMGARRTLLDRSVWVLRAPGERVEDLAPILGALREEGFGFLDHNRDVSPAAAFDAAVGLGLLNGRYLRVIHGVNGRGRPPGPRHRPARPAPTEPELHVERSLEALKQAESRRKMNANKERQKRKFPRHPDGGALDYVRESVGSELRITARRPESIAVLTAMGAQRSLLTRDEWTLTLEGPDVELLAAPFARLRDAGFGFVWYEHSWPPSAIFDELVSRGLLSGEHLKVKLG